MDSLNNLDEENSDTLINESNKDNSDVEEIKEQQVSLGLKFKNIFKYRKKYL